MGKPYKQKSERADLRATFRLNRVDITEMDFLCSKYGLISRTAAVRFALNFTCKEARNNGTAAQETQTRVDGRK